MAESIHKRVQKQIELILDKLEEHPERYTTKDRLMLVQVVGMYMTRDLKLKAADESEHSGSTVRKYAQHAFRTQNVPGGGKKNAGRSKPAPNGAAPPDTTTGSGPLSE